MIPFLNRPLMEYALQNLLRAGVEEVYVLVGYLEERIMEYLGEGSDYGIEIHYSNSENAKLGTSGATRKLVKNMDEAFFVVSSDVLTNLDLRALYEYHLRKKAPATIALSRV